MDSYQTWTYTFLSLERKAIDCKWVFKVKYHLDGLIERYKTKRVAQGFSQVHKIDYTEIFTSTVRRKSLRIFLVIAAMLEMILIQIDVVGVYLKNVLSQNKYPSFMRIPQRYLVG